ncbi:1-aminocyclopropane-1-carboxylate deaminase/D-cysteine desulfhydrase [Lutimonas vermicola]|uniref:Pyridoxal-phosphate dependent enzyme n=1 Tax=Lutimonas vermicola TaxID=414288 RepID=A0ABU9L0G9_9FLAO
MSSSRNQLVSLKLLNEKGIRLVVKREDELHPIISGNKYRKLKYNLLLAKDKGCGTLLSYGGAYSNHISALSYAGKIHGFKTIGVIRGDELGIDLSTTLNTNPTLKFAYENGMQFKFVSRAVYKRKTEQSFSAALKDEFGDFYEIPEGGTNALAVRGCEEILLESDNTYDYICVSVGTGGTISGLINSASDHQTILGFQSLKGDFLEDIIDDSTMKRDNWSLNNEYHFGGYAKINEILISFINNFYQQTTIPLDPVYTGKMMFGIMDLVEKDFFKKNMSILAIHTGGLQGIEGMNRQLLKKKLPLISV